MKEQKLSRMETMQMLVDQLVTERPNLNTVASLANKLNFSFQGDIVDLMTNVLSEMNQSQNKQKNKSNQEVEAL